MYHLRHATPRVHAFCRTLCAKPPNFKPSPFHDPSNTFLHEEYPSPSGKTFRFDRNQELTDEYFQEFERHFGISHDISEEDAAKWADGLEEEVELDMAQGEAAFAESAMLSAKAAGNVKDMNDKEEKGGFSEAVKKLKGMVKELKQMERDMEKEMAPIGVDGSGIRPVENVDLNMDDEDFVRRGKPAKRASREVNKKLLRGEARRRRAERGRTKDDVQTELTYASGNKRIGQRRDIMEGEISRLVEELVYGRRSGMHELLEIHGVFLSENMRNVTVYYEGDHVEEGKVEGVIRNCIASQMDLKYAPHIHLERWRGKDQGSEDGGLDALFAKIEAERRESIGSAAQAK